MQTVSRVTQTTNRQSCHRLRNLTIRKYLLLQPAINVDKGRHEE